MKISHSLQLVCLLILTSCGSNEKQSGGQGNSQFDWSIPVNQVIDAGPGIDGIPALSFPEFIPAEQADTLTSNQLVLGVFYQGSARAYPHYILDYHEVINDQFGEDILQISYCPLTGSGLLWKVEPINNIYTFGVSGLLYNSNLILYDRSTDSFWSQMLEQPVYGERSGEIPPKLKIIETTWGAWRQMYPDTQVLSENTGYVRDYFRYPYFDFRTSENLLFPVANEDDRLHPKTRIAGIRDNQGNSLVYQIDQFTPEIQVINTEFNGLPIVVIGSSDMRFGVIYAAQTDDGVIREFNAVQDQLPVVMQDSEGNQYDLFGQVVSGPGLGQELDKTESMTAYWYAWAAFFPGAIIFPPIS